MKLSQFINEYDFQGTSWIDNFKFEILENPSPDSIDFEKDDRPFLNYVRGMADKDGNIYTAKFSGYPPEHADIMNTMKKNGIDAGLTLQLYRPNYLYLCSIGDKEENDRAIKNIKSKNPNWQVNIYPHGKEYGDDL